MEHLIKETEKIYNYINLLEKAYYFSAVNLLEDAQLEYYPQIIEKVEELTTKDINWLALLDCSENIEDFINIEI